MNRKQNHSVKKLNRDVRRGRFYIVTVNVLIVLASGIFAVAALIDPGLLLPSGSVVTPAADLYVRFYAARSLPLTGFIVALVLLGSTSWLGGLLILAGLIQALDSLIGLSYGNLGQTLFPAVAAVIHLVSASWLLRSHPQLWRD